MLVLQRTAGRSARVANTLPLVTEPVVTRHESILVALRREDRSFLRKLLLIFSVIFAIEWVAAFWLGPEPPEIARGGQIELSYRIDINSATWVEWLQLEGIGPALAHRLEVDREVHGPYASIEDLQRVPGIGPSTLERIRPWLKEP